jgi:hypothetical protein
MQKEIPLLSCMVIQQLLGVFSYIRENLVIPLYTYIVRAAWLFC